jgi:hypothetical protein
MNKQLLTLYLLLQYNSYQILVILDGYRRLGQERYRTPATADSVFQLFQGKVRGGRRHTAWSGQRRNDRFDRQSVTRCLVPQSTVHTIRPHMANTQLTMSVFGKK